MKWTTLKPEHLVKRRPDEPEWHYWQRLDEAAETIQVTKLWTKSKDITKVYKR